MPAALPRPAATLVCVAFVLSATACGPFLGESSGSGIVGGAIEATESAESVSLYIDGVSLTVPLKGRVSLDRQGNCTATMSYGAAGTAELIKVDGKDVYLRRDVTLLRTQERHRSPRELEALVDKVGGRWTRPPLDGPDAPAELSLCDRVSLPLGLDNGWGDASAEGDPTTVDGQKALKVVKSDSESETTVYVAAEGAPYILKIVTKGGETPGTTTYSHYDRPVEAKAPSAEDVVLTG